MAGHMEVSGTEFRLQVLGGEGPCRPRAEVAEPTDPDRSES